MVAWKLYFPKDEKNKKALLALENGTATKVIKKVYCDFCTEAEPGVHVTKHEFNMGIIVDFCTECDGARILEAKIIQFLDSDEEDLLYAYKALESAVYVAPTKITAREGRITIDLSNSTEGMDVLDQWATSDWQVEANFKRQRIEEETIKRLGAIQRALMDITNRNSFYFPDGEIITLPEGSALSAALMSEIKSMKDDIAIARGNEELMDHQYSLLEQSGWKLNELAERMFKV